MASRSIIKFELLICIILFAGSNKSLACSCEGQSTVKGSVNGSTLVIVGKILSKDLMELKESGMVKFDPQDSTRNKSNQFVQVIAKYEIIVMLLFKGKITDDTLIIYSGSHSAACGYEFVVGKEYIIYGSDKTYFFIHQTDNFHYPVGNNIYWTSSCSRTTNFYQPEIDEIMKYEKLKWIPR